MTSLSTAVVLGPNDDRLSTVVVVGHLHMLIYPGTHSISKRFKGAARDTSWTMGFRPGESIGVSQSDMYIRTIERRKRELLGSSWLPKVLGALKAHSPKRIRCLALGKPSLWINAQYQLAFLIILQDAFSMEPNFITVWDPALTSTDKALLSHFGFQVGENHPPNEGTLWFIPHGPVSLILQLSHNINLYLGNDMSVFEPRVSLTDADKVCLGRLKAAEITRLAVSREDKWFTAMSDLAIHVVA